MNLSLDALVDALRPLGENLAADAHVTLPIFAVAVAALTLRFRLARRAQHGFDASGRGTWVEGRSVFKGALESASDAPRARIGVAYTSKSSSTPGATKFVLEAPLVVETESGRRVEMPTGVTVNLGITDAKVLVRERTPAHDGPQRYAHTYSIVRQKPLWFLAKTAGHAVDAGPMRSGGSLFVEPGSEVSITTDAPVAPECSIAGAYALVWCSGLGGVWLSGAEGWRTFVMVLLGLFAVLSLVSLNNTLKLGKQLREQMGR